MNLGLVHPYIYYLNNFILILFFLGWLGSYIKRDSWVLNLSLIIIYYLSVTGASILSSIIIIFLFSADYLLNLDLFFSLLMIGVYIYLSKIFITMFKFCKYSNGTYTGEMKAFRRHGQGTYIYDTGENYNGKWNKGKKVN